MAHSVYDTHHNYTQHNNVNKNCIQHNNKNNSLSTNNTHHYDSQHNYAQLNKTQNNSIQHKDRLTLSKTMKSKISCRIFEHFAAKPDPVTEFIKLRSARIF
jgi:hypothetical protein